MGLKNLREQRRQVQPLPGRSPERTVVEIEPVHIDGGAHRCPPQKARASEEAPLPAIETARGVAVNLDPWTAQINPVCPAGAKVLSTTPGTDSTR